MSSRRVTRFPTDLAGLVSSDRPTVTPADPVSAGPAAKLPEPSNIPPSSAMGELLTRGAPPRVEREIITSVDPRRCKPWKYHDRRPGYFTVESCKGMIDSIRREKQKMPALARKIEGDPDYDYELIYGMRRRFACEHLNIFLRIVVRDIDDRQAALEMDIENREREDVTAMERAMSYSRQVKDGLFATQDALASAVGLTQGRISQWFKAVEILEEAAISRLFPDPSQIPVKRALALASQLENERTKIVLLKAATNMHTRGRHLRKKPSTIIAELLKAPERSHQSDSETDERTTFGVVDREVNVGASARMRVKRNAQGKISLVFQTGFVGEEMETVLAAVKQGLELLK